MTNKLRPQAVDSEGSAAKQAELSGRKEADARLAMEREETTQSAVAAGIDCLHVEGKATIVFGEMVARALGAALVGIASVKGRRDAKAGLYRRIKEQISQRTETAESRCPDPNRAAGIWFAYSRATEHVGESAGLFSITTLKALARFVLWDVELGEYRLASDTADAFRPTVESLVRFYNGGQRPSWKAVQAIVDAALGYKRDEKEEERENQAERRKETMESGPKAREEERAPDDSEAEEESEEQGKGHSTLPVRIPDPVEAARVAMDALNNSGDPDGAWEQIGRNMGGAQIRRILAGILSARNKKAYDALVMAVQQCASAQPKPAAASA